MGGFQVSPLKTQNKADIGNLTLLCLTPLLMSHHGRQLHSLPVNSLEILKEITSRLGDLLISVLSVKTRTFCAFTTTLLNAPIFAFQGYTSSPAKGKARRSCHLSSLSLLIP